jgi:hypothetical protein
MGIEHAATANAPEASEDHAIAVVARGFHPNSPFKREPVS